MTFLSNLAPRLPREIPGFYYDEDKKRYFKIESHPTAPANAAWAASNVKKRKADKAQAQQKRKRQEKLKGCIKRSSLLAHPLSGGRLLHEFGAVDPEMPVECWTAGLRHKGEVSFLPGQEQNPDAPGISCLLVEGGDEAAGLGMAYTAIDGHQLQCSYIPTDEDENINFGITDKMRASYLSALRTEALQDHSSPISSISYHRASHTMIVTSTTTDSPDGSSRSRINLFHPRRSDELEEGDWEGISVQRYGGRRPTWLLGETDAYISYSPSVRGLTIHATRTRPPSTPGSSGIDALIATSHGIMCLRGTAGGDISWVTPQPPSPQRHRQRQHQRQHQQGGGDGGARPPPRDVFSIDYHPNPHVCYAGCRDAKVLRVDTRAPPSSAAGWDSPFSHRSSAAHVRCLDDHHILVAGPRSAMAIYDTRWAKPSRSGGGGNYNNYNNSDNSGRNSNAAQPVVEFPGYNNEAHIRIGLDVTHDAGGVGGGGGGGGGVVAAALGDGTVGVFSLRTGRRLRAGDVDDPRVLRVPGAGRGGGVVKALQFQRLPWEKEASLFAGVGPVVRKFTFGVGDGEDEW